MRLLDLFCGAGGAAVGYHRAGFTEIVGVDIKPQPHYPFTFVQADALEFVKSFGAGFDVIHASPPCQAYSYGRNYNHLAYVKRRAHLEMIEPTRKCLLKIGRAYVIENVQGASRAMKFTMTLTLCGTSFGLRVQRHRLFESNYLLMLPQSPCRHAPMDIRVRRKRCDYLLAYRDVVTAKGVKVRRPPFCPVSEGRKAMGIDWMTSAELGEAIPPAYTEFIGRQVLAHLRA